MEDKKLPTPEGNHAVPTAGSLATVTVSDLILKNMIGNTSLVLDGSNLRQLGVFREYVLPKFANLALAAPKVDGRKRGAVLFDSCDLQGFLAKSPDLVIW